MQAVPEYRYKTNQKVYQVKSGYYLHCQAQALYGACAFCFAHGRYPLALCSFNQVSAMALKQDQTKLDEQQQMTN